MNFFKKLFQFGKTTHDTSRLVFQVPKHAHDKKGGEIHFNKQILVVMQCEE